MQDIIALLQSLTLPAGITSGQRIVLDGINGRIQIFDAGNNLVAEISPTDIILVQDPTGSFLKLITSAGQALIQLNPPNQPGHTFDPAALFADSFSNLGQEFPETVISSPAVDGQVAAFIRLGGKGSGGTPGEITLDTGSATGLIVPFGIVNIDAAGDLQLAGNSYPRGKVATPNKSTAATAGTVAETKDGGVGDYAFTAIAGRLYRVHYSARFRSTAALDAGDIRIRDGGAASPTTASTLITAASQVVSVAGGPGAVQTIVTETFTLSAGTHTFAAFYTRTAGAGNVSLDQAGGQSRELYVEDMGTP
jgi:hypothetical protein